MSELECAEAGIHPRCANGVTCLAMSPVVLAMIALLAVITSIGN